MTVERLNKEFMGGNRYDGILRADRPLRFLYKHVLIIEDLLEGLCPVATWAGDYDIIYEHRLRGRAGQRKRVYDNDGRDTGGKVVYMGLLQDRAVRTGNPRAMPGRHTHGIPAYFLGWQHGRCFSRDIGDVYNLFLTPQLSGCTFVAVGADLRDMKVAHFNGRMSAQIRQACEDCGWVDPEPLFVDENDINQHIHSQNWHTRAHRFALRSGDYPGESLATIIGCRINRTWHFYYQIYQLLPSAREYQISEVGELQQVNL
jgi:hypothetical protein